MDNRRRRMDEVWDGLGDCGSESDAYHSADEEDREDIGEILSDEKEKKESDVDCAEGGRQRGDRGPPSTTTATLPPQKIAPEQVTRPLLQSYSSVMLSALYGRVARNQREVQKTGGRHGLERITSLWSGLWPALLLCSNPSIHYTVYDTVKAYVLRLREGTTSGGSTDKGAVRLTAAEAFAVGMLAKFAATIVTYPLIRAKVMLICGNNGNGCGAKTGGDSGDDDDRGSGSSMTSLLADMYRTDGVAGGLYRGCSLQLMHTVLKSALLMAVRERISEASRRLVRR